MAPIKAMRLATAFATLALATLALPSAFAAAEDETLCRDIASVIDLYLAGKADAGELKAIDISEALAKGNLRPEDPCRRIFSFLGGGDVDLKKLAVQTESRPDLWALASMARFVRAVSANPDPDPELTANALYNYQYALNAGATMPEATKWRNRIPAWLAWCEKSFALTDGLEPLLRKRSRDPRSELAAKGFDVNLADFEKSRAPFAKRPQPDGLVFPSAAIEMYLSGMDNDRLRDSERARYNYIKDIKNYLLLVWRRTPYSGKVKLTKGRTVSGTLALANENFLLVRDPNTEKSTKCLWGDLLPEQYADFLSYYAKMRSNVSGPSLSDADKSRMAAEDLAHASILCDWQGRYAEALNYAKQAARICPAMAPELSKLLLGR